MRIREAGVQKSLEVYGIYWDFFEGRRQRFHFVVPDTDYPGFVSVPESQCQITDPSVDDFVVIKDSSGCDLIVHKLLSVNDLLDQIIDHRPGALRGFLESLEVRD